MQNVNPDPTTVLLPVSSSLTKTHNENSASPSGLTAAAPEREIGTANFIPTLGHAFTVLLSLAMLLAVAVDKCKLK